MPDELLPPDPSKDGWYWLTRVSAIYEVWRWLPSQRSWYSKNTAGSVILYAETMAQDGYTLASPHPIPTPEQLNALHATLGEIYDEQAIFAKTAYKDADYGWMNGTIDTLRKIRAALGAKPDDPPGNGLDDIRAAAMAVSEGRSSPYKEGYRNGLTGRHHTNPWDGRLKPGREWKQGYLAGLNDKAMQSQGKDEAEDG